MCPNVHVSSSVSGHVSRDRRQTIGCGMCPDVHCSSTKRAKERSVSRDRRQTVGCGMCPDVHCSSALPSLIEETNQCQHSSSPDLKKTNRRSSRRRSKSSNMETEEE